MQMARGESGVSNADAGHSTNFGKLRRNAALTSYSGRASAARQRGAGNEQRHANRHRTKDKALLRRLVAEYVGMPYFVNAKVKYTPRLIATGPPGSPADSIC